MLSARLRRQDGFIREILWMALAIAIVAVVLLDALALFNAHQTAHDNARSAALAARQVYAQTSNVALAKEAAQTALAKRGDKLVSFSTSRSLESDLVFNVGAQGHANTYAFKYLRYVGLKKWVDSASNPIAVEGSD